MNISTSSKSQVAISESLFTLYVELVNWVSEESLRRRMAPPLSSRAGYFNNVSLVLGQGSSVENPWGVWGGLWNAS